MALRDPLNRPMRTRMSGGVAGESGRPLPYADLHVEFLRAGGAMGLTLGCGHLSDDEFVSAFEECRIEPANFHHGDHVRLAWLYAGRYTATEAEEKLLIGIWRFAVKAGVPEKFQYSTTVAWARLLAASRKNSNAEQSFDEWIAEHPQFLDRRLLDQHYSKGKLETEPARSVWVEPDLMPFD